MKATVAAVFVLLVGVGLATDASAQCERTYWFHDYDRDGYGNPYVVRSGCLAPPGWVRRGTDCDDRRAAVNPGAAEVCDVLDNDCDGAVDEGIHASLKYYDADGDGFGTRHAQLVYNLRAARLRTRGETDLSFEGVAAVTRPVLLNLQLSPTRSTLRVWLGGRLHPQVVTTLSTGLTALRIPSEHWNRAVTSTGKLTLTIDVLRTGVSDLRLTRGWALIHGIGPIQTCLGPPWVSNRDDCSDSDARIYPGAAEVCNGGDDDCDTYIDDGVEERTYLDTDEDGYGVTGVGYHQLGGTTYTVFPHGLDMVRFPRPYASNEPVRVVVEATGSFASNDHYLNLWQGARLWRSLFRTGCDHCPLRETLFIPAQTWNRLARRDTWLSVSPSQSMTAPYPRVKVTAYVKKGLEFTCIGKPKRATRAGDCAPLDAAVNPGATETCDDRDNDCDGLVDEGVRSWLYTDADGDGYGVPGATVRRDTPARRLIGQTSTTWPLAPMPRTHGPVTLTLHATGDLDGANETVFVDVAGFTVAEAFRGPTCYNCWSTHTVRISESVWNSRVAGRSTTIRLRKSLEVYGVTAYVALEFDEGARHLCTGAPGTAARAGDCDDANNAIHPGATEVCDRVDNDCDGTQDNGVRLQRYRDRDGDGYGAASPFAWSSGVHALSRNRPVKVTLAMDHLPQAARWVYIDPWARGDLIGFQKLLRIELEGLPATHERFRYSVSSDTVWTRESIRIPAADWNRSVDASSSVTFLVSTSPTVGNVQVKFDVHYDAGWSWACPNDAGWIARGTDCDDTDRTIHPNATETCDTKDNDCDGEVDELLRARAYRDLDGDGYGRVGHTVQLPATSTEYLIDRHPTAVWSDVPADIAGGDVTLTVHARGALSRRHQNITVRVGGATFFAFGTPGCYGCWRTQSLTVRAVNWNSAMGAGGIRLEALINSGKAMWADVYLTAEYVSAGRNVCLNTVGYSANVGDCDDQDNAVHPGASEVCDGVDNNCFGGVDDGDLCSEGDVCDAGQCVCDAAEHQSDVANCGCNGACPPLDVCQNGACACVPSLHQSDVDNCGCAGPCGRDRVCQVGVCICDPQRDGLACPTGLMGVCEVGTLRCGEFGLECVGIDPGEQAEVCDGLDNNCNGTIDEGTDGQSCNTGEHGICAAGVMQCQNGQPVCARVNDAAPETCDGRDNDCDGGVDEGNPGGGAPCQTDALGPCAAGTLTCRAEELVCLSNVTPSNETCDNVDNDCDGHTDEDLTRNCDNQGCDGAETCEGGQWSACDAPAPSTEVCDQVDNDCDGDVDEDDICLFCDELRDLGSELGQEVDSGFLLGNGDDFEPSGCNHGGGGDEIVLSWTAPSSGIFTFDTRNSDFDTILYARAGSCDGEEIACDDDTHGFQSELTLTLEEGELIVLFIDGYANGDSGTHVLNITPPVGCEAMDLGGETGIGVATGTTVGGRNHAEASCKPGGSNDVVYTWNAPATGTFVFHTEWPQFGRPQGALDTVLHARGDSCEAQEQACNDDNHGDESAIVLDVTEGQIVTIVVDGDIQDTGPYRLSIMGREHVEVCDNGSDDDGDGHTDCADPSCSHAIPCFGAYGIGDFTASNAQGPAPLTVLFDWFRGGNIEIYDEYWLLEYGDGAREVFPRSSWSGVSHTYAQPGAYTARLTQLATGLHAEIPIVVQ